MMSLVSDPFMQLILLIGTGVICLGMAVWLRAPSLRSPASPPVIAVTTNPPSVLPKIAVPRAPELNIETVVQHGRIFEIKGTTEPGAVVMINGQPAVAIFSGNQFRHFLGLLPKGTTVVSVTCQNEQGGVTTQQIALNID